MPAPEQDQKAEKQLTLARLDRKEWWHWATALIVLLFVTLGMAALSVPTLMRDISEQHRLDVSVTSLLGIVLLFDVYAVYQQLTITRLRRQLTSQIGMMATLEMLKAPDPQTLEGRNRKREFPRYYFDRRVSLVTVLQDKPVVISGRTNDLGEGGLGAVLPEAVPPGTEVTVQLRLHDGEHKILVPAVVRHRRGFHHGIEFRGLTPAQAEAIRNACEGATQVTDPRQLAAAQSD